MHGHNVMSQCYNVTILQCYNIAMLQCNIAMLQCNIAMLQCNVIAMLQCNVVTMFQSNIAMSQCYKPLLRYNAGWRSLLLLQWPAICLFEEKPAICCLRKNPCNLWNLSFKWVCIIMCGKCVYNVYFVHIMCVMCAYVYYVSIMCIIPNWLFLNMGLEWLKLLFAVK